MAISTITYKKYRTSCGKDFDSYQEAFQYETEESFHEWYTHENALFGGSEDSKIDSDTMLAWIKDKESFLYNFLHRRHYLLSIEE